MKENALPSSRPAPLESADVRISDDDTLPSTPYAPQSPFALPGMTSAVYRRSRKGLVRRAPFSTWARGLVALLGYLGRALRRVVAR